MAGDARLVPQTDLRGKPAGPRVCVSCELWNHWHDHGEPCDVRGCECGKAPEA